MVLAPPKSGPIALIDRVSRISFRNIVAAFTQHLGKSFNTFMVFDYITYFLRIYPKGIILTAEVVFRTKKETRPMESRKAGDPVIWVEESCCRGRGRAWGQLDMGHSATVDTYVVLLRLITLCLRWR